MGRSDQCGCSTAESLRPQQNSAQPNANTDLRETRLHPFQKYWCGNSPSRSDWAQGAIPNGSSQGVGEIVHSPTQQGEAALLLPGLAPILQSADPTHAIIQSRRQHARTRSRGCKTVTASRVMFAANGQWAQPPPSVANSILHPYPLQALSNSNCNSPGRKIGLHTKIRYRTESCCIPTSYYNKWMTEREGEREDGIVSNTTDTLSRLWPTFDWNWSSDYGSPTELIECWNIPTNYGETYGLFYRTGRGAPYQVLLHAIRMVNQYYGAIRDTSSTGSLCQSGGQSQGQALFTLGMVQGLGMDQPITGDNTCLLRIAVADRENSVGVTETTTVCPSSLNSSKTRSCSSRVKLAGDALRDHVPHWDDFQVVTEYLDGFPYWHADTSSSKPGPDTGPWKAFSASRGLVLFSPAFISYCGQVLDDLLLKAHICMDYGIYADDESAKQAASKFARYALRVVAEVGEILIHELGHKWAGTGHCEGDNKCCFDKAGQRWLCRVIAGQGLPFSAFTPTSPTDFPSTTSQHRTNAQCGGTAYGTSCSVSSGLEQVGSSWSFCNDACDTQIGDGSC